MSTTTAPRLPTPDDRRIEAARFERAVTTEMRTERVAGRLYRVTTTNDRYDVELESGACTCPDYQYRGDEFYCKHALRAAVVEIYATGVTTRFVARVAAHARAVRCPHGHDELCDGPTGPRLPCPGCCDAARSATVDEFDIWTLAVTEDR